MNLLSSDKKNFREVADKLRTGNILAVAESCGLALAESFFTDDQDNQATITGYEKLIGVNIIRKLQDEFNGNPAGLKNKLSRLVKHAAVMAKHHPSEINDGPSIRESMFVILPDYKDDETFLKEVTRTIESLSPQGTCKVSTGGNPNEIVVINLESNLTPRYLKSVEVLRNSYDRLMGSAQGKVALFETQLEDYESLPSLYKLTDEELRRQKEEMQKKAIPHLLMARGMNILQEYEEPETGITKLAVISTDEYGSIDYDNITVLGKNIELCVEKLDENACTLLSNKINESLSREYRHIEKQTTLKQAMAQEVKSITAAHNNSISDPVVRAFNEAFKVAREIIDKINA